MPRFGEAVPPTPEGLNDLVSRQGRSANAGASRGPQSFEEVVPVSVQQELRGVTAPGVSPYGGLPVAATGAEFYDAIQIFENEAGDFYDPRDGGFNMQNNADDPITVGNNKYRYPAPLSVVPTSTTNARRPRTVAAGFDRRRLVLTVVFRDGTYYNYYEVPPSMWQAFKARVSKGRFIRETLDFQPRGPADVAALSQTARETLSRLSRTGQILGQDHRGSYRTENQHRRNATQRSYRANKKK